MATFTSFSDILPDPNYRITDAGTQDSSGAAGPGFARIKLTSVTDTAVSRTISGRGVHTDNGSHRWEIDISYHPMLREEFDTVDAFLAARNGRLHPFFVVLPNRSKPKDPTFANFVNSNDIRIDTTIPAGASIMMINSVPDMEGSPRPGDLFNVDDPEDINHLKVYKVTRVETGDYYQEHTDLPTAKQRKIHFSPPLVREASTLAKINFVNPKFRVITKSDVQEYDLNTDNLYSFSLSLEEILS